MDPLIFFFDVNIGKRLPEALSLLRPKNVYKIFHHNTDRKLAGLKVETHRTIFKEGERDDVWLSFVGNKRWIVFTQDEKFHKPGYEHELSAIKQFEIGCFYIWGASAPLTEQALVFLKALDSIIEVIKTTPKPFIYKISKSGKLTQIKIP